MSRDTLDRLARLSDAQRRLLELWAYRELAAEDITWYEVTWQAGRQPADPAPAAPIRVLARAEGRGAELARAWGHPPAESLGSPPAPGTLLVDLRFLDDDVEASSAAPEAATEAMIAELQALVRELAAAKAPVALRVVTRGAQAVASGEVPSTHQAAVWGAVRSIAWEHPELDPVLVDLDPGDDQTVSLARICAPESGSGDKAVALRGARLHVPRLVRRSGQRPVLDPKACGSALIAGGLGALGLRAAKWLAAQGCRRLVLTSRTARDPSESAAAAVASLRGQGIAVDVVACDVARTDEVAALRSRVGDVDLIIHAAGVLADGLAVHQTSETLRSVLRPKVEGSLALCSAWPSATIALFSSAAALFGSPGQSAYAAANAFQDALAARLRGQGRRVVSIQWGPWAGAGMANTAALRWRRLGIEPLSDRAALGVLAQALAHPERTVAALPAALDGVAPELAREPLLEAVLPASLRSSSAPGPSARAALAGLPAARRRDLVRGWLQTDAAEILGAPSPDDVARDRPLNEAGMTSLMAVEFRARVGHRMGLALPATLVFNHPTVDAIADLVLGMLFPSSEERPPVAIEATPAARHDDAIAIIGMAGRFPGGARDVQGLWRLLSAGVDAIEEVPIDRWDVDDVYDPDPDVPGKVSTRWGGFIRHPDRFDAQFFGITPTEARSIDPQQRLLLEVAWEAIEDSGYAPERMRGESVGVYAGVYGTDYLQLMVERGRQGIDAYTGTGVAHSLAANRISYQLGLMGPSVVVDTACSSSLVAVHLACQALRLRECDVALAGGANLMLSPEATINLSRAHMMAGDGRCRTFDAAASGYVRGEGAGMIVLKPLGAARRDGDRIWAVVRGSAVNSDGRSNGITAPNGPSQVAVIRRALECSGLGPGDVHYVEAHGTGTPLGDPIEVASLAEAYGRDRERPMLVGSIKSNIGHLEAAAGIAGLIKAALSLSNGMIPATLHLETLNPHIAVDPAVIRFPKELRPWDGPRRAGVSSFGFGGTNSHVILEGPPAAEPGLPGEPVDAAREQGRPHLLCIGARSQQGLARSVEGYLALLVSAEAPPLDHLCATANRSRDLRSHRTFAVGSSPGELADQLRAYLDGDQDRAGRVPRERPALAFLFGGQGAQRPAMARDLYEVFPVVRAAIDECADATAEILARPLKEVLFECDADEVQRTEFAQPALFAFSYAVVEQLRAWGLSPDITIGHSVGELAAAVAAGVLSPRDAAAFAALRGRAMQALPAGGAMAALQCDAAAAAGLLPADGSLSIAAINSPRRTVLSGRADALDQVLLRCEVEGIRATRLRVSHAFHSALMDEAVAAIESRSREIPVSPPRCTWISTVTARPVDAPPDGAYWAQQARHTVRFGDALAHARRSGDVLFVDISPTPGLLVFASEGAADPERRGVSVIRRGAREDLGLLDALGRLVVAGLEPDWAAVHPERRVVSLPSTAPFDRQRHWFEPAARPSAPPAAEEATSHPLLGARIGSGSVGAFDIQLGPDAPAYLRDHVLHGHVVVPASMHFEMALAAGQALLGGELALRDVSVREALALDRPVRVRVRIWDDQGPRFEIRSAHPDGGWTVHAEGRLSREPFAPEEGAEQTIDLDPVTRRCDRELDAAELYETFSDLGIDYGSAFQAVRRLRQGEGEALGELELPDRLVEGSEGYRAHPSLMDAAMQVLGSLAFDGEELLLYVPVGARRIAVVDRLPRRVFSHVRVEMRDRNVEGDVHLLDERGRVVAEIRGLQARGLPVASSSKSMWSLRWVATAAPAPGRSPARWRVVGSDERRAALRPLLAELRRTGGEVLESSAVPAELAAGDRLVVLVDAVDDDPDAACRSANLAVLAAKTAVASGAQLDFVTVGAQAVRPGEPVHPAAAGVWGLGRALQVEQRSLGCRLLDIDPDFDAGVAVQWMCGDARAELQGAVRGSATYRPVLRPWLADRDGAWRPNGGRVLITGALGEIGRELSSWLVSRGARHLSLITRQTPGDRSAAAHLDDLRRQGARVDLHVADVTDRAALASILAGSEVPCRAVFHLAGVLEDGTLQRQDEDTIAHVFRPKVRGTAVLDELTRGQSLDAFVVFSSAASVFGSPGQLNYAAANAYMDSLIAARRARGDVGVALQWGPWSVGMARRTGARGMLQPLRPRRAFRMLGRVLATEAESVVVACADPAARFAPSEHPALARPCFDAARPDAAPGLQPAEGASAADFMLEQIHKIVGLPIEDIDQERTLDELGLDSLMEIQIKNRLEAHLGGAIPIQLLRSARISELLRAVTRLERSEPGGAGAVVAAGPVPLTPFQDWFLHRDSRDHNHANLSLLLRLREEIDIDVVHQAVDVLVRRHESLSLRFAEADGRWTQTFPGIDPGLVLQREDLQSLPVSERVAELERRTAAIQASLDIQRGPVARFVHFRLGPPHGDRLMVAIHWLATDAAGVRFLLEELHVALTQVRGRQPVALPRPTTSFVAWARDMRDVVNARLDRRALDYWVTLAESKHGRVPVELQDGPTDYASNRVSSAVLEEAATARLLRSRVSSSALVLAALGRALVRWCGASPLIAVVAHGRTIEGVDLSRTVGRIAVHYPFQCDDRIAEGTLEEAAGRVMARLAAIPGGPEGYGVLSVLDGYPSHRERLAALENVDVVLDYRGQLYEDATRWELLEEATESRGPDRPAGRPRPFLLHVAGTVAERRLRVQWGYSRALHRRSTIEELMAGFTADLLSVGNEET